MKEGYRHLKGKGEMDYDFVSDILFFKTAERNYNKSIELGHMIIDIDKEDFIVGIQILEASKFLHLSKAMLMKIPNWKFNAKVTDGVIEIQLVFQIVVRNKIIEKNPIIVQPVIEPLPNSELVCKTR